MDVHLLSRLLKELIIDNDRIALPGMGYFQAEPMPAYFSEDGKTIYPPSKRISFKWDDIKQLKPMLHERKFIDFPGVGRLKLTLDGSAYFVTDNTDGGVFSQAFGFEPVILKPVTRSSESTSQPDGAPTATCEPDTTDIHNPEPEQEQEKPGPAPENGTTTHEGRSRIWIILLSVAAAIIIAAVILILLGRSGHLDSLIYSDEELELIQQQGA